MGVGVGDVRGVLLGDGDGDVSMRGVGVGVGEGNGSGSEADARIAQIALTQTRLNRYLVVSFIICWIFACLRGEPNEGELW